MRWWFAGLLCLPALLAAQTFTRNNEYLTLRDTSGILPLAWSGGTYIPKAQFVDIDGDGDLDLFVDQADGRITQFSNEGTDTLPEFVWVTDHYQSLDAGEWALFADLDADGDPDLLVHRAGSVIAYYENTGSTQQAHFDLRISTLTDTSGQTILSEDQSVPVLCDIDGDGDLDFFTGRSAGTLALYANVGSPQQAAFHFVTDMFQGIQIITPGLQNPLRHGASSIVFEDIDHDGDSDMFWGDFFSTGIYYLENLGTAADPFFPDTTTSTYPSRELLTGGYNAPRFADIDHDGDDDLFVCVLFREADRDNFWFYRNAGTADSAQYQLVRRNFLAQLDVGRQSRPVLVDIDGDGDADMFLGTYDGHVRFHRNLGPALPRTFEADTTLDLPVPAGEFTLAPVFVDIDGDGDADAFAGDFSGRILFFENTGTAGAPAFTLVSASYAQIDVGNYSAPAFGDIDGDGDPDLLVGESDGSLNLFPNLGTPQVPHFDRDSVVTDFITGLGSGDAMPQVIDDDADGDLDVFAGMKNGRVSFVENTGDPTHPAYTVVTTTYKDLKTTMEAAPWFVDIDGDGDRDLLLGNLKGGVEFYLADREKPQFDAVPDQAVAAGVQFTCRLTAAGSPPPHFFLLSGPAGMTLDSVSGMLAWTPALSDAGRHVLAAAASNEAGADTVHFLVTVIGRFALSQNAPNPFNGNTWIAFDILVPGNVELSIYNVLGQNVRTLLSAPLSVGTYRIPWDGRDRYGNTAASGVYIYRLHSDRFTRSRKMLLVK